LLAGDDAADAAAGFLDIALVAGHEVDMGMGHGLAGGGMDIDPHIESVGVELPLEDGFDLIQEDNAVRLLLKGQVKVIGAMPGGDHQGMPLAHRKLIKNGISQRGFRNHRPIRWEGTKGTCRRLVHAGGLNGLMALGPNLDFPLPKPPVRDQVITAALELSDAAVPPRIKRPVAQQGDLKFFLEAARLALVQNFPVLENPVFLLFDQIGGRDFVSFLVVDFGIRREQIPEVVIFPNRKGYHMINIVGWHFLSGPNTKNLTLAFEYFPVNLLGFRNFPFGNWASKHFANHFGHGQILP